MAGRSPALWEVEPRLNREALGGLVTPQAQVIASRYTLALARAAERCGMTMRHGDVVDLERPGEPGDRRADAQRSRR